ncbi:MAG: flagellar biosynthetic protein FliQ [Pseudomonadota bacterium]
MTEQEIIIIMREFLWAAVWMGVPLIGTALIIGIVIGLFQALTSIQEQTLTFAPKLIAIVLVYWLSAGYMTRILVELFNNRVLAIIAGN